MMKRSLTRSVPEIPLPPVWRDGPVPEPVEAVIAELTNRWSIAVDTARVLARLTVMEERRRIVEFGAGVSSRVFASAMAERGGGTLTSVEENLDWCRGVWSGVEAEEGVDAALLSGRVRVRTDRRGAYYGYEDREAILARGPFDLVFVDNFGGYGRDGPLHAVFDVLVPGALVVLDDAARVREQATVRRWLLNYAPALELLANDRSVERGIAVLRRREGVEPEPPGGAEKVELWGSGLWELVRKAPTVRKHRRKLRRAPAPPAG